MSIQFYRFLHIVGLLLVLVALSGVATHVAHGGGKSNLRWRGQLAAAHGVGLLLILVSGFGMLAKLGLSASFPGWVVGKLLIWLLLGGLIALAYRRSNKGGLVLVATILGATVAAYLGLFHG